MVNDKIRKVPYRRKREQKTNYKRRLALLKSGQPRLAIRLFNKNILAQVIKYSPEGDRIISSAYSGDLKKYGWSQSTSNISAAYLTGLLLSRKAKMKNAILDTGLQRAEKGSKLYACLKGCIDGGIDVPHSDGLFPNEKRIRGEHVSEYASKKPGNNQFSKIKNAKDISKIFEDTKSNIMKAKV